MMSPKMPISQQNYCHSGYLLFEKPCFRAFGIYLTQYSINHCDLISQSMEDWKHLIGFRGPTKGKCGYMTAQR